MTDPTAVHFISGLPRSGSTLLSTLLRQNPMFMSAVTSPVLDLYTTVLRQLGAASEFASFFSDDRRARILKGLMRDYHAPGPEQVVFDTARLWTRHLALIDTLFPDARIICCVRDVPWIMDSVERMLHRNPLQTSAIFEHMAGLSIANRTLSLMEQSKGFIGAPWSGLREAWFGPFARKLIIIPYESLANRPKETLDRLYACLGAAAFAHRFDGLESGEAEYDARLGMPGLHDVRSRVSLVPRQSVLPPELISKYAGASFWRDGSDNPGGAAIL
nr:sulfotransferase [uncultured Rhodopila sp.]